MLLIPNFLFHIVCHNHGKCDPVQARTENFHLGFWISFGKQSEGADFCPVASRRFARRGGLQAQSAQDAVDLVNPGGDVEWAQEEIDL